MPLQQAVNLHRDPVLQINWYAARQFLRFYASAQTRYQVHSPFVFEWANAVLEDRRWYYAFDDIEHIRTKMLGSPLVLDVPDYGAAAPAGGPVRRQVRLDQLARTASSPAIQGRRLFRLVRWLRPTRMLELGTSVGVGALYLASAAQKARLITLEGSEACAHVARANLEILGLQDAAQVITGPFNDTLKRMLGELGQVDLVFFDGHHLTDATLRYFELCVEHAHHGSVFVFDDIYWSAGMQQAWNSIQAHARVRLTIDCFDLGFAFFNPAIKTKQHFRLAPGWWKPWKRWI